MRYRAFLMQMLADGTDPSVLEKNMRTTMRFFFPQMTEIRGRPKGPKSKSKSKSNSSSISSSHSSSASNGMQIDSGIDSGSDSDPEWLPEVEGPGPGGGTSAPVDLSSCYQIDPNCQLRDPCAHTGR